MSGDYMVTNACFPTALGGMAVTVDHCAIPAVALCTQCGCFHAYGCCPGNIFAIYPTVYPGYVPTTAPAPAAAEVLLAQAKARLAHVEAQLAQVEPLTVERERLRRTIAASESHNAGGAK